MKDQSKQNSRTGVVNFRIDKVLRHNVRHMLRHMGITESQALRMFYSMILLRGGLPFDVMVSPKTGDSLQMARQKEWEESRLLESMGFSDLVNKQEGN